jgi:hypothetical protein
MHVTDKLLAGLVRLGPSLSHLSVSCKELKGLTAGAGVPTYGGLTRLLAMRPTLTRLSMSNCFAPQDDSDNNGNLVAAELQQHKLQALLQIPQSYYLYYIIIIILLLYYYIIIIILFVLYLFILFILLLLALSIIFK